VKDPDLEYTYFEISPDGILLHGTLAILPWLDPDVEFEKDLWALASKPAYVALNSWIPGGTIKEFDWDFGRGRTLTDTDRFVTVNAPPLTAMDSICLKFSGSRITASGPVSWDSVSSPEVCKWTSPPMIALHRGVDAPSANRPQVLVPGAGPSPRQGLDVVAHVSPWAVSGPYVGTANFLVHFPDLRSAGQLDILKQSLIASGRTDTETAILCVLTTEQVSSVSAVEGLMYADDAAPWEQLLAVRGRPATVLLNPAGQVVWRHDGEIGSGALVEALRANLAPGGKYYPQFVESPLCLGERSPDFVFETAPGERLTLRKLAGRPVVLVFWRSSSTPSVSVIRNLQQAFGQAGFNAPAIIAIDDGENGDFGRGLVAGEVGAIVVVPDPARQISQAYCVSLWPTIVVLDAGGLVQDVRFGLISPQDLQVAVGTKPVPKSSKEEEC
jgi:cytochrome c biogenesis protein CcmG/thiol:disulfide interchange protein DsbE